MKSIYNYSLKQLENYFLENGQKKYRARQIYDWLYQKKVNSFFMIKNINKELIIKLNNDFSLRDIKLVKKQKTNNTKKYLFKLNDDNMIEAVLLKQKYGNSLCISTQVGCNMGCAFCASGIIKKIRDLSVSEMIQQILLIEETEKVRISHIVVMGIGEPFDNYRNVIDFINIINDPFGLKIGARHITVSTCGIIPKIEKFIEDGKQVNLAISLHATNDKLRDQLMPINKKYPLKKLIQSVEEYISKTNRRVTFEYIMLENINDRDEDAYALVALIKHLNCYVNLISYNPIKNLSLIPSKKSRILQFYDIIKKNKVNVTIRQELGVDIKAACGQLRSLNEEG